MTGAVPDVVLYQFHDIDKIVKWVLADYRIGAGDETVFILNKSAYLRLIYSDKLGIDRKIQKY